MVGMKSCLGMEEGSGYELNVKLWLQWDKFHFFAPPFKDIPYLISLSAGLTLTERLMDRKRDKVCVTISETSKLRNGLTGVLANQQSWFESLSVYCTFSR